MFKDWADDLEELESLPALGLDANLSMWDQLDNMIATLSVYRKTFSNQAADHLPFKETYHHPDPAIGDVHRTARRSTKADGAAILSALSEKMVVPNSGEVVSAIPVEVLQDVLPACSPGATSSKWKSTGLGAYIDQKKYIEASYSAPSVARGPRRA